MTMYAIRYIIFYFLNVRHDRWKVSLKVFCGALSPPKLQGKVAVSWILMRVRRWFGKGNGTLKKLAIFGINSLDFFNGCFWFP